MKKQTFYYQQKLANFEYREEPEGKNTSLDSIKKLLSTGIDNDWNEASNIFKKILFVRFVPANLNVSQSDTPFKEIDWQDEIDATNVDIRRFGWNENDELPWVSYTATFEIPVNPAFATNDELSQWQDNNDELLNFAFTSDLEVEDDNLYAYCSSDEGTSVYIND